MGCVLAMACTQVADRPERALAQFLGHVQKRRAEAVWSGLSADSQRRLRADEAALAEAAQRPPSDDVGEILFRQLRLRAPVEQESIVVVGPLGPRVRLRVTVPTGRSAEVWMVQEDGGWKVDLVGSLTSTSTSAGTASADEIDEEDDAELDEGAGEGETHADLQPADADSPPSNSSLPIDGRPDTKTPRTSSP